MSEKRRRFKIYRDEAKERLTNHWDWDYMGYDSSALEDAESPNSVPAPTLPEPAVKLSLFARVLSFFHRSIGSDKT